MKSTVKNNIIRDVIGGGGEWRGRSGRQSQRVDKMDIKSLSEMSYYFIRTKNFKYITSIEPANSYEDMSIYYTVDVLSFVHVSATYCGHPRGGVFRRIYYKEHQK